MASSTAYPTERAEAWANPAPDPGTIVVGLIGAGIDRSRTPKMHEEEGRAQGLPYVYRILNTDHMPSPRPSFEEILKRVEQAGYAGVNVTHPFKRQALSLVDEVSEKAAAVGAINTIVFRDSKRFGHNTDCWGFEEAFRREMAGAARDRVLLFGAGGAGGAVATALLTQGVGHLSINDVDTDAARALADNLTKKFGTERVQATGDVRTAAGAAVGIVNATPIGMASHPGSPVDAELLRPDQWVADIVYFPLETELLRTARAIGCRTMPGSGMAVFQAVRAYELFTGHKADSDRMKACFDAFSDTNPNRDVRGRSSNGGE